MLYSIFFEKLSNKKRSSVGNPTKTKNIAKVTHGEYRSFLKPMPMKAKNQDKLRLKPPVKGVGHRIYLGQLSERPVT